MRRYIHWIAHFLCSDWGSSDLKFLNMRMSMFIDSAQKQSLTFTRYVTALPHFTILWNSHYTFISRLPSSLTHSLNLTHPQQHCVVQYCTALHCTVSHCTMLKWNGLNFTTLYEHLPHQTNHPHSPSVHQTSQRITWTYTPWCGSRIGLVSLSMAWRLWWATTSTSWIACAQTY